MPDLLTGGALQPLLLFFLQYYLKTGTCKFGSNCKYHHPKQDGSVQSVILNNNGFPLRPVWKFSYDGASWKFF